MMRLSLVALLCLECFFEAIGYFKSYISTPLESSVFSMPDKETERVETN